MTSYEGWRTWISPTWTRVWIADVLIEAELLRECLSQGLRAFTAQCNHHAWRRNILLLYTGLRGAGLTLPAAT